MPETPASSNLSGYTPHLVRSLEIIERASPSHSASIIDVGGGESTLVDDLLTRGYQNITVLDVSQIAMDVTKKRLGTASESVRWIVADVTKAEFAPRAYDVWHDRAVFHFLTAADDRLAYVRQVANAVNPEDMCCSVRSGQRDQPNAAALTLFAMTRTHFTGSSVCVSGCWRVSRNYIAHRLGRISSSFTACAGSNNKKRSIAVMVRFYEYPTLLSP